MIDESITIADVLPVKSDDDLRTGKWENFKDRISKEIKGIKWTASIPDIAEKIGDLLNIKIPGILTTAWSKADSIKEALLETRKTPDKTAYIELTSHKIKSEYNPYIEIRINGIPLPKKINFNLLLTFDLKGFILKIQDGLIKQIRTGSCTVEGQFSFQDLTIAKKELFQLDLPKIIEVV